MQQKMTIKTNYQRFQHFPTNRNFVEVYKPDDAAIILKKIIDARKGKLNYKILSEGTGVSTHYLSMFYKGKQHGNINLLTLYKITAIITQRSMSKNFAEGFTKVKLVNPNAVKKLFYEQNILFDDVMAFVQGELTASKVIHNLKRKTFNFDTAVAFTACYKFYKKTDLKKTKKKKSTLNPNVRKLRRKNDAIERYRSGYMSSIQQKVRKTS